MKSLLISILIILSITVNAQLSTNQRNQVTTMIATAVNPLKSEIAWLKSEKKKDSIRINNAGKQIMDLTTLVGNLTKENIILKDSMSKFKETYFMPPFFNVRPGIVRDSVQFIPIQ